MTGDPDQEFDHQMTPKDKEWVMIGNDCHEGSFVRILNLKLRRETDAGIQLPRVHVVSGLVCSPLTQSRSRIPSLWTRLESTSLEEKKCFPREATGSFLRATRLSTWHRAKMAVTSVPPPRPCSRSSTAGAGTMKVDSVLLPPLSVKPDMVTIVAFRPPLPAVELGKVSVGYFILPRGRVVLSKAKSTFSYAPAYGRLDS